MLRAINTKRDYKNFSALQVHRDMSLQETSNNRWIIPDCEIEDWGEYNKGDEIELTYIKESSVNRVSNQGDEINYYRTPYFKRNKYNKSFKTKKQNKTHKRVQNFVFNYLIMNRDNIKFKISKKIFQNTTKDFDYIYLKDLQPNFETLDMEITIKGDDHNKKRADVFLEIGNKDLHKIFGKALCIEIQLSYESNETIEQRTLDRALLGMSTIWIMKKDLIIKDVDIYLKDTENIFIKPYINILNSTYAKAQDRIRLEYESQGILLDSKIEEIKNTLSNYSKKITSLCENYLDKIKKNSFVKAGFLCPECGKGSLNIKKGKYGKFLGCSRFTQGCKAKYSYYEE